MTYKKYSTLIILNNKITLSGIYLDFNILIMSSSHFALLISFHFWSTI